MKILFVGATGAIGSEVLEQCLVHPEITSIIAFSRRELPSHVASNSKLQVVIKKDFSSWAQGELEPHADAGAMVWMMGTYAADEDVHVNYPLAFQQAFIKVLKTCPGSTFRDIHLSGHFVVRDQESTLWFLPTQRKLKVPPNTSHFLATRHLTGEQGQFENRVLAFAAENDSIWKTFSVRPAAVVTRGTWGGWFWKAVLGDSWSIGVDVLGTFVAKLAVGSNGESGVIFNKRMAVEGKEALRNRKKGSSNGSEWGLLRSKPTPVSGPDTSSR